MTWYEYECLVSGYNKRLLNQWKQTRAICWQVVQGYADPKKLPKDINLFWNLEPEKKMEVKQLKGKKLKQAIERISKFTVRVKK